MAEKELVMYTRSTPCMFVNTARSVLETEGIPYREIQIDTDPTARERVLAWTGFLSVPTLIITAPDAWVPLEEPSPLPSGASPRGVDRGGMITEPSAAQLAAWLRKHGLRGS